MASSISPVISASLCMPPTKSMMRMGLHITNQLAAEESTPTRRAIRGVHHPMIRTPTSAGTRISMAETKGAYPASTTIP